jgi:predicted RNA-binding protein YlqC (UPF0109 family)
MPESPENRPSVIDPPDYVGLIRFLVQPFLELPDSLKIDCEISQSKLKVWVRLAIEGSDKGRVFGRGGRNIQAIRTVLETAAHLSGYSAYLDVYGGAPTRNESAERDGIAEKPHTRPSSGSKSSPRLRSR